MGTGTLWGWEQALVYKSVGQWVQSRVLFGYNFYPHLARLGLLAGKPCYYDLNQP